VPVTDKLTDSLELAFGPNALFRDRGQREWPALGHLDWLHDRRLRER